jgi:hypothetical protein
MGRPALPVVRSFGAHPVERVSRRVQFCSLLLLCRVLVAAAAAAAIAAAARFDRDIDYGNTKQYTARGLSRSIEGRRGLWS